MLLQLPQEFEYLLAVDKVESNSGSLLHGSFSHEMFPLHVHLQIVTSPISDLTCLHFSANISGDSLATSA